ncbi:hypothetical protein [Roseateles sp.]|uniref:hypothetical protein n=1 Tax=Roseateles sp. TaxID=1971397 RepID=UPI003BAA47D9
MIRKELPQIASSLRRLKYKDVELEFGEAAKQLAAEVKEAVPQDDPKPNLTIGLATRSDAQERLQTLAGLAPRSAILEAWLLVESAAADAIRRTGLDTMPGPQNLMQRLQKGGLLRPRQMGVFENLRRLRNEAVHSADAIFSQEAVLSYVESAVTMAAYLEELGD